MKSWKSLISMFVGQFAFVVLITLLALLSSYALLGTASWFIVITALTTTPYAVNIFLPSSLVRFFSLLRIVLRYFEKWFGHQLLLQIQAELRSKLFYCATQISPFVFRQYSQSNIVQFFITLGHSFDTLILHFFIPFFSYTLLLISVLIFCVWYFSSVFLLLWLLVIYIILYMWLRFFIRLQTKIWQHMRYVHSLFLEQASMQLDIYMHQQEAVYREKNQQVLKALKQAELKMFWWQRAGEASLVLVCLIGVLVIFYYAYTAYLRQQLTPGMMMVFVTLAATFLEIVSSTYKALIACALIVPELKALKSFIPDLSLPAHSNVEVNRSNPFMRSAVLLEIQEATILLNTPDPVHTTIELPLASRKVDSASEWSMYIPSLTLKSQEKVLLTGSNGSGKSTLLLTLMGECPLAAGRILWDGLSVDSYLPNSLYEHIAFLDAKPAVFSGTLRDNLQIIAPNASDEKLLEAIAHAGLYQRFSEKNDSTVLDISLGETDWNLSYGQRLRLGLARMLLSPATVWLLDEPTAHLDLESHKDFVAWLQRYANHKTILLVSHRSFAADHFFTQHWHMHSEIDRYVTVKRT